MNLLSYVIALLLISTAGCATTNPPLKEDPPAVRLCAEWAEHISNKLTEENIPYNIEVHAHPPMFVIFGKGVIVIAAEKLPPGWEELGKIESIGKCQISTKVVPISLISFCEDIAN
jgi:hypothetical protein